MNDPQEVLRWYEWYREKWTEKRHAPADLTDSEILDFIDEYVDSIQHIPASQVSARRFVIEMDGMKVRAGTLREAICLAKAVFDKENT